MSYSTLTPARDGIGPGAVVIRDRNGADTSFLCLRKQIFHIIIAVHH